MANKVVSFVSINSASGEALEKYFRSNKPQSLIVSINSASGEALEWGLVGDIKFPFENVSINSASGEALESLLMLV